MAKKAEKPAPEAEEKKDPFKNFVDHQMKAWEEFGKAVESLFPAEFREHGKAAVDSTVDGFRGLMNSLMDELKEATGKFSGKKDDDAESTTGPAKVKVEVKEEE